MREAKSPRKLGSTPTHPAGPPAERATNYQPTGPAGEASVEQVEEDAARAWLAHVQAGRIR